MESQQGAIVPVIYLHEIKRQYLQGEVPLTILDNAKLALWAGQSVALVAPSGSGKSTLLHIAGLLEAPDYGEVYVNGTATSHCPISSVPSSAAPISALSTSRTGCCRNFGAGERHDAGR